MSEQWFKELNAKVLQTFNSACKNMKDLKLLGCIPKEFVLETDWSGAFGDIYLLFTSLSN